jgi:hypothetical protein
MWTIRYIENIFIAILDAGGRGIGNHIASEVVEN